MAKTNVGTMPCSECGREVVVKEAETTTLSYSCAWCDDGNYAKPGTVKRANWLSRIKPLAAPEAPGLPAQPAKPTKAASGLIL